MIDNQQFLKNLLNNIRQQLTILENIIEFTINNKELQSQLASLCEDKESKKQSMQSTIQITTKDPKIKQAIENYKEAKSQGLIAVLPKREEVTVHALQPIAQWNYKIFKVGGQGWLVLKLFLDYNEDYVSYEDMIAELSKEYLVFKRRSRKGNKGALAAITSKLNALFGCKFLRSRKGKGYYWISK